MNQLARALYSPVLADPRRPANTTRFVYLHPEAAEEFFVDYDQIANDAAAMLRLEAGRNPHDKALIELVGELSTRASCSGSAGPPTTCSTTAAAGNGSATRSSASSTSTSSRWSCPPNPGLQLNVYTAAAGTPTADALKLLASWAATQEQLATEQTPTTRSSGSR